MDFFKDVFDLVNLVVIQILLNKVVDEDFCFTVTNKEFVILIKDTIGDKRYVTFFFVFFANVFLDTIVFVYLLNKLFEAFFI